MLAQVQSFSDPSAAHSPSLNSVHSVATLSSREHEVAMLMASSLTNKQIARGLAISPHTVRSHAESIMRKLRASNRAQVGAIIATHQALPITTR